MTNALVAALMMGLAACQPPKAPAEDRKDAGALSGACGADALQGLAGQERSVLATMKFGTTTRVIEGGMPITMDYSQTRLNFAIGKNGRILRVFCG